MVEALEKNPTLEDVSDYTVDSGEGKWTVEEAIALDVPMPVISASLFARFASRQEVSPTMQAVAALRGGFGGHQVMTIAEGKALRAANADKVATPAAQKKATSHRTAKKAAAKKTVAKAAAKKRAQKKTDG
jgi:6-phosphogluconate dehydrogenase